MGPVTLLLDAAWTVASLALVFLLPGLSLGAAVAPGAMSPGSRLGRALVVSMVATAAASVALTILGLLRPTILVAVLVGLAVLPLHAQRPQAPRLPRGRARQWWIGGLAIGIAAFGFLLVPGWLEAAARGAPAGPSWEDVAAAQAMATLGGLPPEIVTWGSGRPFTSNHPFATAHLAAALQLLPGDILVRLEAYRVALVAAGVVAGAMAFRRWLSSALAVLATVLVLSSLTLAEAFRAWDPLAWATVVALGGLWLIDRALVERRRRLLLAAAASGACVLLAHPAVFLVWLALVAGAAAARTLVAPGGGPEAGGGLGHRHGRRLGLRRRWGRSAVLPLAGGMVIAIGGVAGGLLADGALTGQPGVAGYLTGRPADGPSEVLTRIAELPQGWRFSDDATWDLARAATGVGDVGDAAAPAGVDRELAAGVLLRPWPRVDGRTTGGLVILGGALVAAALGWVTGDARRQRLILMIAVFAIALGVGAQLVVGAADSFAGRDLVVRRVLGFGALVPAVAGVVGLWLVGRLIRTWWPSDPRREAADLPPEAVRRRRRAPALTILAVLAALTGLVSAPADLRNGGGASDPARQADPSATALEAYRWIAANVRDDARILVAAHTSGTVAVLAERSGLVDGPLYAPEDPLWPAEPTARLLGARRLFTEPDGPGASAYVEREAVDYVLMPGPAGGAADLGGHAPFEVDVASFEASDRYRLVRDFGGGRVLLYQVTPGG